MSEAEPENKTVLVVDDEREVCEYLATILAGEGFRVFKATDGESFFEILKEQKHVDLITMDLMMPGRGGYDIIQELQSSEETQKIPVMVITARMLDAGTAEHILTESNVRELWGKPFDQHEFRKKVHQVLGTTSHKIRANSN